MLFNERSNRVNMQQQLDRECAQPADNCEAEMRAGCREQCGCTQLFNRPACKAALFQADVPAECGQA